MAYRIPGTGGGVNLGSPGKGTPLPPASGGGALDKALGDVLGQLGHGGGGQPSAGPTVYNAPGSGRAPTPSQGQQVARTSGGGSSGGSLPGMPPGPISNRTQTDPNSQWLIEQIKQRTAGQGPTQQAMDIAGSQIRDYGEGFSKQISEDAARRGISGSGAEAQLQGNLARDLQKQVAGSSSKIALQRQQDIDRMLLGSGGIFAQPAQLAQGDRELALRQYLGTGDLSLRKYLGEGNLDVARQGQNFSQQQALLNAILSMY